MRVHLRLPCTPVPAPCGGGRARGVTARNAIIPIGHGRSPPDPSFPFSPPFSSPFPSSRRKPGPSAFSSSFRVPARPGGSDKRSPFPRNPRVEPAEESMAPPHRVPLLRGASSGRPSGSAAAASFPARNASSAASTSSMAAWISAAAAAASRWMRRRSTSDSSQNAVLRHHRPVSGRNSPSIASQRRRQRPARSVAEAGLTVMSSLSLLLTHIS